MRRSLPRRFAGDLRRAMLAVAAIAFVAAALGIGVRATFGAHVAVDETQYALTALSLAEDRDLDISDELAAQRWRAFADVGPPPQTQVLADGRRISPHDPLLPMILAIPMGLGGWVAAKLTLAAVAGLLAALTLWVAVRRLAVPLGLAAVGVGVAAASAPLAVYGQQIYPELPAALVTVVGVAALTGPLRRGGLVVAVLAVTALPWLSIKYAAVAAALGLVLLGRLMLARRRVAVIAALGGLAGMAGAYVVVHRLVWGGWTVYASGDHFQQSGEFGVVGFDPNYIGRGLRLVGLFVDREYGVATWQPAWLLLVLAVTPLLVEGALVAIGSLQGALVSRVFGSRAPSTGAASGATASRSPAVSHHAVGSAVRNPVRPDLRNPVRPDLRNHSAHEPGARPPIAGGQGRTTTLALLVPLVAGWLVATFIAVTMHGYWWPGRQLVVVLPLAVLAVLRWLAGASSRARLLGLVLGLAGVATYITLLIDGYAREITWVSGFHEVDNPLYQAYSAILPDYRGDFWALHIAWTAAFALLLVVRLKGHFNRERPADGALVAVLPAGPESRQWPRQPVWEVTIEKGSTQ